MPPTPHDPDDPAEWIRRARSNLARARGDRIHPDVLYEDLCFDAQQAAEKALKELLLHRAVPFPWTHSIGGLLALVAQAGMEPPEGVREASVLTDYAAQARCPGRVEEVSREDDLTAVELAERVVGWVETIVSTSPPLR